MSITLELTKEVVARLQAEADRRCLSVGALVEQLAGSLPDEAAVTSEEPGLAGSRAAVVSAPQALRQGPDSVSLRVVARLPLDERLQVLSKAKIVDRMDGIEAWEALPWNEPA